MSIGILLLVCTMLTRFTGHRARVVVAESKMACGIGEEFFRESLFILSQHDEV